FHDLHFGVVVSENSHVKAEGLKLFQKHLEGLRNSRFRNVVALDDGFVGLHTSYHVVGFHCKDLLQSVGSAVRLQSPYLHLSETLTSELSFTAQRLLCYQRVGACGTRVDLVVYQMMQLQIVHVSDRYRAVKIFSGPAVAETHFTVAGNGNALPQRSVSLVLIKILHNVRRQDILVFRAELLKIFRVYIIVRQFKGILDIFLVGAVDYRSGNIESQRLCRKTEMDLKHLSDIDTGGHAQRIQHDIQGTAVRQERHIFNRKHTGYDTLVSMTACHFVAYR